MTTKELTQHITSFASLILNRGRIQQIQAKTAEAYIGRGVIETFPNGQTADALIMQVSWEPTCGLDGDWLLYVAYTNVNAPVVGAWLDASVLTLKDGE